MAKLTIAQLREIEVKRLASYKTGDVTEDSLSTARRLMNSFYRLCGLAERNLYLSNTERTCNLKSTARSEEREEKWYKRLDAEFNNKFGLRLCYCGYTPSIGTIDPAGGFSEKINRWFY